MLFHSTSHPASFTYHLFRASLFAAALAIAPAAHAVLYWDANSNLAGTGTWDTTSMNWRTTNDVGAPNSTWTPNDGTQDAVFGGNPGNGTAGSGLGGPDGKVTVVGTVNVNSITLAASNPTNPTVAVHYSITGGALNITNPTSSIVMQTNTTPGVARQQIIASPISGTDITVVANAVAGNVNSFLTLGGIPGTGAPAMAFTGDLIFGGTFAAGANGFHQININNPTALPTTAEVRMRRTQSQLLFTGGGPGGTTAYTHTFNNDIILNDSGGGTFTQGIGAQEITTQITLGGVISGDAHLRFELGNGGGQGTIVLANQATYTGTTTVNTANSGLGTVRLGIDDALPVGTPLSVVRGRFDLGGFDQRVGGLSGPAGNGRITNTGSASTLTIDGNDNGTYAGLIGAATAGHNDNIALILAPTNTSTLTLSNSTGFGNTYTGGTTINGGRLVAGNDLTIAPFSSATGTGPVAVNDGGILGGTGAVGGPITIASGGLIAPGLATGDTIGTLTAFNALSFGSGSRANIGLGSPAPGGGTSDRINMPNTFGNFALTVPAAASSIGVNLSDPAGGAAGNGTYILMSFQAGQYTGSNNAAQFFTNSLPSPNSLNGATIAYHLADDTNTIQDGNPSAATRVIMTVSGGPNALLWTGGAGNGNWNVGTTANFNNSATGASTTFAGNDNVTFDDSGANTNPITVVAGGVQPNIVTVNNSTATYTFSGGDIKGSSLGGGGGLFLSGTGAVTINNNYTAAAPITSNKTGTGAVTFNGNITNATSLTVTGGSVTLAGTNTYTGDNTVNGGTLTVQGTSATFGAGDLTINAGSAVISAGVADAILDTATLTLAGGGTANTADVGFINLDASINELVGSLVLGTATFTSGTFGATGSGALNIMDEYFAGTGIITVGSVGLPGDHNSDGAVDAADYVAWRKNPDDFGGNPNGYNTWRTNFGSTAGSGGSLFSAEAQSPSVPEPTSLVLIALGILAMRPNRHGVVPRTR